MPATPPPVAHDLPLRWDIQALRGVAVAWVLLQHLQLGVAPGGFLGVDIFFVISGFLITGQVLRGLEAGRFSPADFYARRARRLLPAAYVVLALTLLAGSWLLGPQERAELVAQHWGALGLASNYVLWGQSGYFSASAELKPLLHFWSLSLEEQYYLLLPALLLLAGPGRRGLMAVAGLVLLSFVAGLVWQRHEASAAFYGLPTRAWELGLGSLGAWAQRHGRLGPAWLRGPAAVLLLVLPLAPLPPLAGLDHPGANALLVALATLALLLSAPAAAAPRVLRPLVGLGDISYSLYLVHWPLIAFVNNAWVGPADAPALAGWRAAAGLAALPLAWALWRGVEQPTRRWPLPHGLWAWARVLGVTVLLALLPLLLPASPARSAAARAPNYGLAASCDQWERWSDRPECRTAARPGWVVWGDSYAMHLVPGLAQTAPGLLQATESSCGPLPGLVPWRPGAAAGASFTRDWARQCERFNRSVLALLQRPDAPPVVLLSSLLEQYLDAPRDRLLRFAAGQEQELAPTPGSIQAEDALVAALAQLARTLRGVGKRLLWVAPPPSGGFDAGACQERRLAGRPRLGAAADCAIEADRLPELQRRIAVLLSRFEVEAGVPVLRLEPALCDAGRCRTADADGLILYRDKGHLSIEGSRRLVAVVATRDAVQALAR